MLTPTVLLYLVIIVTCLMGLLCGVAIISNIILLRKSISLKRDNDRLNRDISDKLNALLLDATKKTADIITATTQKSAEMVRQTELFSAETKSQFLTDLTLVREEQSAAYTQSLIDVQKEMVKRLKEMQNDIEKNMKIEYNAYKEALLRSIENFQKEGREKQQFYKTQLYSHAEEAFYEVFKNLSKTLIKKSLTAREQEELVLKALQEARDHDIY